MTVWGLHTLELREEEVSELQKTSSNPAVSPRNPSQCWGQTLFPLTTTKTSSIKRVPITQGYKKLDPHQQLHTRCVGAFLLLIPHVLIHLPGEQSFPYSQVSHDRRSPANFLSPFPQMPPEVTFSLSQLTFPRNACSTT